MFDNDGKIDVTINAIISEVLHDTQMGVFWVDSTHKTIRLMSNQSN